MNKKIVSLFLGFGLAAMLGACQGGGDNAPATTSPSPASPAAGSSPAPAKPPAPPAATPAKPPATPAPTKSP
ncbi:MULTISPECIES: hypothetical protein [Aerosakkonema]|uniref:hypothetical protein n=1 Tax=Aerosakkonema TaxID=1246629 RepID=UPI0035BAA36F